MGLDMYLTKKTYIGANYEHRNVKGVIALTQFEKNEPIKIQLNRVREISEVVGYWRKANQIHNWFVTAVQNGQDECQESYVSIADLTALRDCCRKVLEASKLVPAKISSAITYHPNGSMIISHEDGGVIEDTKVAEELLPSMPGFFFGGTEYTQYYLEDLKYTEELLTKLIDEESDGEFYYRASW